MKKRKDLTFEQLKPLLFYWAGRYKNNRFEFWELINAVWVNGKVQKLPDIRLALRRIQCDMIDYMRQETKLRTRRKIGKRLGHTPVIIPLSVMAQNRIYNDGQIDVKDRPISDLIEDPYDAFREIVTRDWFGAVLQGLTPQTALMVKLSFIEGFKQVEIAKICGLSTERISQKMDDVRLYLKTKLESGKYG